MTTQLTAGTLTVSITETLTLADSGGSGLDVARTTSFEVASVVHTQRRLVTVAAGDETGLVSFAATVTTAVASGHAEGYAAGHFAEGSVRYIRITNLDDTDYVALKFRGADGAEYAVRVDAGQSYLYGCDNAAGVVGTMDAHSAALTSPPILQDLEDITAEANTSAVDVEVFVALV